MTRGPVLPGRPRLGASHRVRRLRGERAARHRRTAARARARAGQRVLDIGCGSGLLARALLAEGYAVSGVDASPAMIELARAQAPGGDFHAIGLPTRRRPGEAERCPWPTRSCPPGHVLNYLDSREDLALALAELAAALRPGGLLAIDLMTERYAEARDMRHPHARVEDDWTIVTRFSRPGPHRFDRDITVFRRVGELWRRSDEHHANVTFEADAALEILSDERRRGDVRAGVRRRDAAGRTRRACRRQAVRVIRVAAGCAGSRATPLHNSAAGHESPVDPASARRARGTMGWFTAALLVIAAACLTLSAIHAHVWLRERSVTANGAFALLAASVAAMAFVELQMVRATDASGVRPLALVVSPSDLERSRRRRLLRSPAPGSGARVAGMDGDRAAHGGPRHQSVFLSQHQLSGTDRPRTRHGAGREPGLGTGHDQSAARDRAAVAGRR